MRLNQDIYIYNSLNRKKEIFKPINPPFVGIYKCGPTVYGEPHLGHARSDVAFDVIYRYFKHLDFKVRYVRNITDVGHLENDGDEGEDKIAKKARLEQLEPMEIVQQYTISYHEAMGKLNCLRPNIEPTATAHIIEQIALVQKILDNGYAYLSNGSVYFDMEKYTKDHEYGRLSGKIVEDLLSGSRDLSGQEEKKNNADFALWKKASEAHIMKWPSPWSIGFPGWHLECSAMSTKYLGETFDIHAGGMDLQFPHHEAEIAQSVGACGKHPANYWIHNNMLTIEGQKMGKSLGNFITIKALFEGNHKVLEKAYSPMNVRFFILQAHYRSTLDFSNKALQASEKGLLKLSNTLQILDDLNHTSDANPTDDNDWQDLINGLYRDMNDDFNTAKVIAGLFELSSRFNAIKNGQYEIHKISKTTLENAKQEYRDFLLNVLGLLPEENANNDHLNRVMNVLISMRNEARSSKNYALSDEIRDKLAAANVLLKDEKGGGTSYSIKN